MVSNAKMSQERVFVGVYILKAVVMQRVSVSMRCDWYQLQKKSDMQTARWKPKTVSYRLRPERNIDSKRIPEKKNIKDQWSSSM